MWTVIISMIKDAQGVASSKRGAMLWCLFLFSGTLVANIASGGRLKLDHELQSQLFELVIITLGLVFGEPFAKAVQVWKGERKPTITEPPAQ
jgi:hypothetical protein